LDRAGAKNIFVPGIDYYPVLCLYSIHLVPSEGALEGAQVRGRPGRRRRRCAGAGFGTGPETSGRLGRWPVKRQIRKARAGGPSRVVPARLLRVTGDMTAEALVASYGGRFRQSFKRWVGSRARKGRSLKE